MYSRHPISRSSLSVNTQQIHLFALQDVDLSKLRLRGFALSVMSRKWRLDPWVRMLNVGGGGGGGGVKEELVPHYHHRSALEEDTGVPTVPAELSR